MKTGLIVVDMQNDFIAGSLGTMEAQAVVPAVCARIRRAAEAGEWIACTMDTHEEDYLFTQEGSKLPVAHCIRHTRGWELHPDVAAALPAGVPSFCKETFGSMALAAALPQELEAVELIGLCTDICVISNALLLKAARPELRISVNAACCAGVTPKSHQTALEAMGPCQIDIV